MTAAFRIFSWRIMHPQPILLRRQPFCFSDAVPKSMLDITKTMKHAVVSQFALGDSRCNTSLGYVPATFSCVCKCCDFVPATCRLSVYYTRFCRGNMSLQHDPSCLATVKLDYQLLFGKGVPWPFFYDLQSLAF